MTQDPAAIALFYGMSAERLRSRTLYAGVLLLLSVVVPYEVIFGHGLFVWDVLGELPPAGRVGALAPTAAGLVLVVTALWRGAIARPTSRAILAIALFLAVNVAVWLGRRSSAWGVLPLPDAVTTRPAPLLAVYAFTAAGAVLRFHAPTRRAGSALLLAAIGAAVLFYAWPSRGEIPAELVLRSAASIAALGDVRFQIGYGALLLLVLSPLVIALLGLMYVRDVPRREHPGLAILAVWGTPTLVLLFVYRAFLMGGGGPQAIGTAFFALLFASVVAVLASAVEVLTLGLVARDPELPESASRTRPLLVAGAALFGVVALGVALSVLGRPAPKGVTWAPGQPTPGWDKVFGELLPRWERARQARDEHAKHERGPGAWGAGPRSGSEAPLRGAAEAQVATKARAREMTAAARAEPNSADFVAALESLTAEVDGAELSGRAFARLVGDVNDAARRADLPYYLDPSIWTIVNEQGTQRRFFVKPYRLSEARGYSVGDKELAALIVEPLAGDAHVHLGFSRDNDPFALVIRSEIADYAGRFAKGEGGCNGPCESASIALKTRLGDGLEAALFEMTVRHELQHQIDGPHLTLSSGIARALAGYAEESQDRTNRELSAYIAEMTTEAAPPALTLVHLYPFGVGRRRSAEHHVAVLLLETLAGKKLRDATGDVDFDAFEAAWNEQVAKPDADLRSAARAAYEHHYSAELPNPARLEKQPQAAH